MWVSILGSLWRSWFFFIVVVFWLVVVMISVLSFGIWFSCELWWWMIIVGVKKREDYCGF